jgi:probable HAF family extracellular repeat protein
MNDLDSVISLGFGSIGASINDSGQITGSVYTNGAGDSHAFLYSGGVVTNLGTLGGPDSQGKGINNSGQVTGFANTATSNDVFLYSGGVMTDLGGLGSCCATGLAINASGQIAGYFQCPSQESCGDAGEHALLYSGGKLTDLGSLGNSTYESYGEAINASGQVVGWSFGSPLATNGLNQHAFVYTAATGMVDLNALIPANSGWLLTDASAINDAGQIAGTGYAPNGYTHAFLLTPVPAIPALIDLVKSDNLPKAITAVLTTTLTLAENTKNKTASCLDLDAFEVEVELLHALRELTPTEQSQLITAANSTKTTQGCR